MSGKVAYAVIGILLLGWVGVVGMSALSHWPHMPLDISGKDATVVAAYQKAVSAHVIRAALIALTPFAVVGLGLWMLRRRRRS